MAGLPETAYFTVAPEWACEVISPSTAAINRGRKLRIYAREQVRHLWIVDPLAQTLEVLKLEHERWSIVATHVGDQVVPAEPFDALELDLAPLWNL